MCVDIGVLVGELIQNRDDATIAHQRVITLVLRTAFLYPTVIQALIYFTGEAQYDAMKSTS